MDMIALHLLQSSDEPTALHSAQSKADSVCIRSPLQKNTCTSFSGSMRSHTGHVVQGGVNVEIPISWLQWYNCTAR